MAASTSERRSDANSEIRSPVQTSAVSTSASHPSRAGQRQCRIMAQTSSGRQR